MPDSYQGGWRHWSRSAQIHQAFYASNEIYRHTENLNAANSCSAIRKAENTARHLGVELDDARDRLSKSLPEVPGRQTRTAQYTIGLLA
jgi:hypothetical protein